MCLYLAYLGELAHSRLHIAFRAALSACNAADLLGWNPYICASLSSNLVLDADSITIDWSILRCRRNVDICVDSGYSTEPTGYFQLLPR